MSELSARQEKFVLEYCKDIKRHSKRNKGWI